MRKRRARILLDLLTLISLGIGAAGITLRITENRHPLDQFRESLWIDGNLVHVRMTHLSTGRGLFLFAHTKSDYPPLASGDLDRRELRSHRTLMKLIVLQLQEEELDLRDTPFLTFPFAHMRFHWWHYTAPGIPATCTIFAIPLWSVVALGFTLPLLRGLLWIQCSNLRRRRLTKRACLKCGYDLRSSPNRCPECGAASALIK